MKMKDPSLLSCWPDGFSRYYSVSNVLRILFGEKQPIDILDVGGDSQWMIRFLDNVNLSYALHIVDTRKPDFKNTNPKLHYTQADFFKIKAADFKADAVINTDVLEHIPPELKIPFVNQCIDFASSVVILSAPQDNPDVTYAEHKINDNYSKLAGKQQRWLKEHFEFGKPDSKKIEAAIKKRGLPYLCINTNNLDNWFTSFSLNFINSEVFALKGMDEFNRYYNEHIHSVGDFEGLPYRKIFVIFKNEALFKKKQSEIIEFFAAEKQDKLEFLSKTLSLLIENFTRANEMYADSRKKLTLLEKNLKQTQRAYVKAQTELDAIKASKSYRYTTRVKKSLVAKKVTNRP